ncbi:MAG: Exosome non-catalytic core component [Chrysothrix sp. TS-e1954]|nr:MAG: Exosome non-catalytic core component [Chrysothrix sp. TS-e1954]
MPLDTSTYSLALLRLDGRRWNELRHIHGQISTQPAADGSSYLEMGNTKVLCTVSGPEERRGAGGGNQVGGDRAQVVVEINIAGFSGVDRRRKGRGDKRQSEMQKTIEAAFASTLFTHVYPQSTITIFLHVLAQDGSLLAALLNAATLALVDAGIPMSGFTAACTAGLAGVGGDEDADPLLDTNGLEEGELPFLTVATAGEGAMTGGREGGSEKVSVLALDTTVNLSRVEAMMAVAVDGCAQVRKVLEGVVKGYGRRMLGSAPG